MGKFLAALFLAFLLTAGFAPAYFSQSWEITSPDRGQTFAYGSERSREWFVRKNHLAIAMHFTNDPYVDQNSPRLYDDFTFNFPSVVLGKDGRTFFYHPTDGPAVPVAVKNSGFLGGIRLLDSSRLNVQKRHGLVTLTLVVSNLPHPNNDHE